MPGEFSMRQAVAFSENGMHYELIEPLTGPSLYHDFLKLHGEALHHIACEYTGNFDEAIRNLTSSPFLLYSVLVATDLLVSSF